MQPLFIITNFLLSFFNNLFHYNKRIVSLYLGAFIKLRKVTIFFSLCLSVCPSIRPREAAGLPLEEFSLNLMFDYFYRLCRENSSFIKKIARITVTSREDVSTFITSGSVLLKVKMFQAEV